MLETVLVWWLVFSNIIIPVPYTDKTQCEAAGKAVTPEGMTLYACVQQPASDVEVYGDQFYRYSGGTYGR